MRAYRLKHQNDVGKDKGSFILVTWLYDLVEMVLIPVLYLLSIPFCLYMASEVFDLTEICMDMFFYPFFNYEYLHLIVLCLQVHLLCVEGSLQDLQIAQDPQADQGFDDP